MCNLRTCLVYGDCFPKPAVSPAAVKTVRSARIMQAGTLHKTLHLSASTRTLFRSLHARRATSFSSFESDDEGTGAQRVTSPVTKRDYWLELDHVKQALFAAMEQHNHPTGVAPTYAQLFRWGKHSLADGLEYHGGLNAVARKLGLEVRKPLGYWKDISNVDAELAAWRLEHGVPQDEMPTKNEFYATNCGMIADVLVRYHGGMGRYAAARGLKRRRNKDSHVLQQNPLVPKGKSPGKPKGYWNDVENVERELLHFISEHSLDVEVMPSKRQLESLGASSLYVALFKYFGGLPAAAQYFKLEPKGKTQKSSRYWHSTDNLQKELLPYTTLTEDGIRVLPSQVSLQKAGRNDIVYALRFHGGLGSVATMFGWMTHRQYNKSPNHANDAQ